MTRVPAPANSRARTRSGARLWQADDEARAEYLARRIANVLGRDMAVQRLDDLAADRQPKTRVLPEFLTARPFRVKPVEDMFKVRLRYPRSLIFPDPL